MFGIGTQELIVILIVALIILGPRKLPGIARAIGRAISQFNRAVNSIDDEPDKPEHGNKEITRGDDDACRSG